RHSDQSGKSTPSTADVLSFVQALRRDLRIIEQEHTVEDDPTGEIVRDKMSMVYGNETADFFFGLLHDNIRLEVDYGHDASELPEELLAPSKRLSYDHFHKKLVFQGVMTDDE